MAIVKKETQEEFNNRVLEIVEELLVQVENGEVDFRGYDVFIDSCEAFPDMGHIKTYVTTGYKTITLKIFDKE